MIRFGRTKAAQSAGVAQLRSGTTPTTLETVADNGELRMFRALRAALPLVDAAVNKLVRLTGGFTVHCENPAAERALTAFLRDVPVGYGQRGIDQFLSAYLGMLLTDGRAIGEIVLYNRRIAGVCWGDSSKCELVSTNPMQVQVCVRKNGQRVPLPRQELLLLTTLHPEPGQPFGVSLLRGMPFVAEILLKIYRTIGINWERAGNVRYSVVCKPGADTDGVTARERSEQMAAAWGEAMRESQSGQVRDFVAVGDVQIKVIGSDGQILQSEVPVRKLLEQIVAKTGLPPFLLGLSWSSTERMSQQQADLLTSELWAIRRTVEPVLRQVCDLFLRTEGYDGAAELVWDEISLQDLTEEAHAALYRAQAAQIWNGGKA